LKKAGAPNIRWAVLLTILLLSVLVAGINQASASSPQAGDFFRYSDTTNVNNGQGSYTGYSEQTVTTGAEQVNSVSGSSVLSSYNQTYSFSNNQGNSTSGSKSGTFTWSTGNYTYTRGTDNQVGYSKPIYVWFAVNPSLSVGNTFWALNTHFTIQSKNFSILLPTEGNRYVQAVKAEGTGQYQRNDVYGIFTATYTWYEYFDPATGYIIGYNYTEQDTGSYQGQQGSFTYIDTLYVTSTSYPLLAGTAPPATIASTLLPYLGIIVPFVILLLLIVIVVLFVRGRRRRAPLPEHSRPPPGSPPQPSSGPWESRIDLGSRPPEQVVIRDVAKVNCRYCGTLIPTTADHCPYCGAPRQ
jgi:hypothetical protein